MRRERPSYLASRVLMWPLTQDKESAAKPSSPEGDGTTTARPGQDAAGAGGDGEGDGGGEGDFDAYIKTLLNTPGVARAPEEGREPRPNAGIT